MPNNPNLEFLINNLLEPVPKGTDGAIEDSMGHYFRVNKRGVSLGGSSRSGKTWAGIDFIATLCYCFEGLNIHIYRDIYNNIKTTLYVDFNKRLPQLGIASPLEGVQERKSFNLLGNKITFLGCDNVQKVHGAGSDIIFFNEAMSIPQEVFDQAEMRCKMFWWMDYNPSESEHWIYESVNTRDDVAFLKTTFRDNPFCTDAERNKILSYCPYEFEDEHLPKEQRRVNQYNKQNGTINPRMWDIYGLGKKAEREGLIFEKVYTYDTLPLGAKFLAYGCDFGFSESPSVVVKVWYFDRGLYIEQIVYETGLTDKMLADRLHEQRYDYNDDVYCDSAEPKAIRTLGDHGIRAYKAAKGQDSVRAGITLLNSFNLYIHKASAQVLRDFENYTWKMDKKTNKPLDVPDATYKHSPDAVAYCAVRTLTGKKLE